MIRFEQVGKVYPDGTTAVDSLSFEVGEGELVTLARPVRLRQGDHDDDGNRLIEPTAGRVFVAGDDKEPTRRGHLPCPKGYGGVGH